MATKNITNVKNVDNTFSAAQAQINASSHNLLYWVRALNSMASRNEFCDGVPVMEAGILCQALLTENVRRSMKPGQFFHASLFTKDSHGRACTVKVSKRCPVWGVDIVEVSQNGWTYLAPVPLSLLGVLRAFRAVCKADAKEKDSEARAARTAAREQAKHARAMERELRALKRDFISGALSARTYEVRVRDVRRKYAA